MADVDLLVEVKSTGVAGAIAELNRLKEAGLNTSKGLRDLGIKSGEAAKALSTAFSDLGSGKMANANEATKLLSKSVKQLGTEYRDLSKLSIGSGPVDRLTKLGGGDLAAGRAIAEQIAAKRSAYAADPVRDNVALKKEELALTERLIVAEQRRNLALANRGNANTNVARAKEDLANQRNGINAVERAQVQLTRATQDLARAEDARKATPISINNADQINTRTNALQNEARATKAVQSAEAQLASARAAQTAESVSLNRQLIAEEQRLNAARAARTVALVGKENATTSVSRAREDLDNQRNGINGVERAQIQLTRATQDLARAEAARKATPASINNAGQINARTNALQGEARAVQAVQAAEEQLASAKATHAADNGNAFQSSYSYFIVAGLAQQAAQAIRDFGAASFQAASQFERAFVDVDRTFDGTGRQLGALRQRLIDLSTRTPVSFVDLSQIAALGNQLGISASNIQSFTTTIAQYSAVSGQSAEDSATAFGKISNLTGLAASQYSNLASSITYVARTSVATEATISRTAQEITALASGAGFSAQGIIGLAGALSSLAIPPERARGSLSLYFGALNSAVAEGGPKMEAFATLTGRTAAEIGKLVRENKGQEVFTSFIAGLSKLDTVAKTTALSQLGLSTIRVDQTMRALSQNVPLLTSSLEGANTAFVQNTEIGRQYAKIQETLNSKFIEFQNAVQNAASALGGNFAQQLVGILGAVTKLVVGFADFAQTPIGGVILKIAGAVGLLAFGLASFVGILALAKASLVVTQFAFDGLGGGISTTSPAIKQFIAGMFGVKVAVAETTVATRGASASNGALAASNTAVAVSSTAAATGLKFMKGALIGTGIGIAVVLAGSLIEAFNNVGKTSKIAAGDVAGLADAIAADTATYKKTGEAVTTYTTKLPAVTAEQKAAAEASASWAAVLGNDLVNGANKASEAVGKVAAGKNVTEAFRTALGDNEVVKGIVSDTKFSSTWTGLGLDMTTLIAVGLKSGGSEKKVTDAINQQLGGIKSIQRNTGAGGQVAYFDKAGNNVTSFYQKLLQLIPALASTGTEFRATANTTSVLASGLNAAGEAGVGASDGFRGAASSLTEYQNAVSSGISKFSDFSTILGTLKTQQGDANKRKGPDGTSTTLINATAFSRELSAANTAATTFFNDLQSLAAKGSSSFATQLASLGPEAQGILSSALKLDPAAQGQLEANARFAAFLASDAFKTAFKAEMTVNNDAYATIFKATGSLDEVKGYIAAQLAGTGLEYERQWLAKHPTLPLNVEILQPTPADISLITQQLNGNLTFEASVTPVLVAPGGFGKRIESAEQFSQIITDKLTGASITLPANLSQPALSASLAIWQADQSKSPKEIAALINKGGLSTDLDTWVKANGKIKVFATLVPTNTINQVFPLNGIRVPGGPTRLNAKGGLQEELPRFATGGGWGQFRGPGSGTSDSILSRVSAGEYINTAESTSFWGPDFFDSLNRKMLPTSFLNMLGAAAGGNQGPQSVTNVNVIQNNPLTRDPLKQLRESSEMVAAGIWG